MTKRNRDDCRKLADCHGWTGAKGTILGAMERLKAALEKCDDLDVAFVSHQDDIADAFAEVQIGMQQVKHLMNDCTGCYSGFSPMVGMSCRRKLAHMIQDMNKGAGMEAGK